MKKILSFVATLSLIIVLGSQITSAGSPFTADGGAGAGGLGRHGITNRTATSATFWSLHPTTRHRPVAIINRVASSPGVSADPGLRLNWGRTFPSGSTLSSNIRTN